MAPRLRVAVLTGIFPPDIGGPATHAADLAAELRRRDHQVTILTLTDDPGPAHERGLRRWPRRWPWALRQAVLVSWLVAHRRSYDVVYATGLQFPAVVGARLAGRPVVAKMVADPAWECASRHGLADDDFEAYQQRAPRGLGDRVVRAMRTWTVRQASGVMVSTESMARAVSGWQAGRGPVVRRISNGVLAPPGLTSRARPRGRRLEVAFVGRLIPLKRVDLLVRTAAACPGMRLTVIGDGPERASLAALTHELGVDERVRFLGALPQKAVLAKLAGVDVLALPSDYEGGTPHVVLEAFVMGTPVVATPVGGTAEVIVDGVNGRLVEAVDPSTLAEVLSELQLEPEVLAKLSAGALASGELYRFEHSADAVEHLLEEVLVGPTARPRVITVGKTRVADPPNETTQRRFEVVARHLEATFLVTGPAGVRRSNGVRLVAWPTLRPRLLGGALFYATAPTVAVALAALRRGTVVVCQSPFEGCGALAARRLLPRRRRPPVVVEIHGDPATASRLYGSRWRRLLSPLSDRLARSAMRGADRVRVIGAATEELVRRTGRTGPVERYVAFSEFDVFLERPLAPMGDEPCVLFIGSLEPVKGPDVLLDAWAHVAQRLPRARLRIVGAGSLEETLHRSVSRAGLGGSVEFLGHVPQRELVAMLDAATCLVLPSRAEGLGRVVLEAMARARPVVGSRVGGIPELVEDGVTGRLFPSGDAAALARALVDVLADVDRAAVLGAAGRRLVEDRNPAGEFEAGIRRLAAWATSAREATGGGEGR